MDESEAFSTLFFAHASRLVRLAALLGDDDPEDVVQEAFCRLYGARGRLRRNDRDVAAYLSRIVVNEVRSRHRHRLVVRRDAHLLVPETAFDPIGRDGDRRAVVAALANLPARQREVLVLRFWMDLPLAQIAEVTRVRLGTVKSQLSRGVQALGLVLGDDAKEER